jgi:cysteine protease IpaJ
MRHRQMFGNSCGASALLCAAGEVGIAQLPDIPGSFCTGQALASTGACESALYQLTCGGTSGVGAHTADLANAGYSMPHSIVLAARLLGLTAEIFIDPGMFSGALVYAYSDCFAKCSGSGIALHRRARPELNANQRSLNIVGVMKVAGLHYVMERPQADLRFMDPADGRDYPSFELMNNSWSKCYADTGICIVLRRAAA